MVETTAIDRQRIALAMALGVEPETVGTQETRWLDLMQEGVLVTLHIRRWTGYTRLGWNDLGLPTRDGRAGAGKEEEAARGRQTDLDLMELGSKRLLPKDVQLELNSITQSARNDLARRSFQTYWGTFLPAAAYIQWVESAKRYQAAYFACRDKLIATYDEWRDNLLVEYRRAAIAAYQRLSILDGGALRDANGYISERLFVETFLERIKNKMRTADEIGATFAFSWDLTYVPLPSLLEEDSLERDSIRRAARSDELSFGATERMRFDVARQAQEQRRELIDGFLTDVVAQLRTLVYEASTDVLASMSKNDGKLIGRSASQLRKLLDDVGKLNFFNDKEIDRALENVRDLLQLKGKERDGEDIKQTLTDIATVTRASLLELGADPRSARDLGIADAPAAQLVRSARRSLGLLTVDEGSAVEVERRARDLDGASEMAPVDLARAGQGLRLV